MNTLNLKTLLGFLALTSVDLIHPHLARAECDGKMLSTEEAAKFLPRGGTTATLGRVEFALRGRVCRKGGECEGWSTLPLKKYFGGRTVIYDSDDEYPNWFFEADRLGEGGSFLISATPKGIYPTFRAEAFTSHSEFEDASFTAQANYPLPHGTGGKVSTEYALLGNTHRYRTEPVATFDGPNASAKYQASFHGGDLYMTEHCARYSEKSETERDRYGRWDEFEFSAESHY